LREGREREARERERVRRERVERKRRGVLFLDQIFDLFRGVREWIFCDERER
jgi:hypothetical protein